MATAVQNFRFATRSCYSRIANRPRLQRSIQRQRCFTSTVRRLKERSTDEGLSTTGESLLSAEELLAKIEATPPESIKRTPELDQAFAEILQIYGSQIRHTTPEELRVAPPFREPKPGKMKPGLLNMGLKPADDPQEDPEFEEDDISSLAHGELDQHREFRHYARLAAWEMPLLTKMAKPFVPPTQKEVLRFRYTTYMGEEHPAEKKVVLEFCPADMPDLTPVQLDKLKKLVGVRYNPETDIVKMSCEMFETQAQNKRYLGDLVDTLLREAKDPTDTFEDIPLDLRHHPIKVKPRFPVEWRMTEERKAELEASRQRATLADEQKALHGDIVDGIRQIQAAFTRASETAAVNPEPKMVVAGKGTAKGKKLRQRG